MLARTSTLLPFLIAAGLSAGCQTTVGNYLANRGRDLGECFRLQAGLGPGLGASVSAGGLAHAGLAVASSPRHLGVGWIYGEGHAFGYGETGQGWDSEVDLLGLPIVVLGGLFAGGMAVVQNSDPFRIGPAEPAPGEAYPTIPPAMHGGSGPRPSHFIVEAGPRPLPDHPWAQHSCWAFVPGIISRVGRPYTGPTAERPRHGLMIGREYPGEQAFLWTERAPRLDPRARIHAFDIEVRAYAAFVYTKVGFSPGEFVDFLLGWFGADIAGDDRPLKTPEEAGEEWPPGDEPPWEK